jgi:hypothetical protein|tara:strand:+ start:228 stop:1781 length:1554 start_codon:yes stop_codon:yes gene_type:complete
MTDPLNPMPMVDPLLDLQGINKGIDDSNQLIEYLKGQGYFDAPDYEGSVQKYQERLQDVVEPPRDLDFYDMASTLGASLLAGPRTQDPFSGLGKGFASFSGQLRANREETRKQRQQMAMQAANLAMQDEQRAEARMDSIVSELVKNQLSGEVDTLSLEYNRVTEDNQVIERVVGTFDKKTQSKLIKEILSNPARQAREYDPATAPQLGSSDLDKKAAGELSKRATEVNTRSDTAYASLDNINRANRIADELGEDGFGAFEQATVGARNLLRGIDWLGIDVEKVSLQEAIGSTTLAFALQNVSKTKGAVSNAEMDLFIKAAPYLGQTYQGFKLITAIQERIVRKELKFASDYASEEQRLITEYEKRGVPPVASSIRSRMLSWENNYKDKNEDSFLSPEEMAILKQSSKNKTEYLGQGKFGGRIQETDKKTGAVTDWEFDEKSNQINNSFDQYLEERNRKSVSTIDSLLNAFRSGGTGNAGDAGNTVYDNIINSNLSPDEQNQAIRSLNDRLGTSFPEV